MHPRDVRQVGGGEAVGLVGAQWHQALQRVPPPLRHGYYHLEAEAHVAQAVKGGGEGRQARAHTAAGIVGWEREGGSVGVCGCG